MKKVNTKKYWFLLGLIGTIIAAPNATVVKASVDESNAILFNMLRFGLISAILSPYMLVKWRKMNLKAFKYSLYMGLCMAVAVFSFVFAIAKSQASYVSILTLITPIVFIMYAVKLVGDKITRRSLAGITLAAAGAFVIVALPIALKQQSEFQFYPVATLLVLLNVLSFPLAIIFSKKAHQAGGTLTSILWISSVIIFLIAGALQLLTAGTQIQDRITPQLVESVVFSGVVVALISRAALIASYEHIGAVVSAALGYLETLIAIVLPVLVLDEKLSIEMVLGGILILFGVYIVEHHKSAHHKHFSFLRHH